ncbi:MAG: hypothetical protein HOO06_15295 [Bdellovibrionaceae bacterium]|jgi:hypothetical protein|nr:hypothetical protein [Pseudobdellovibrionaceae bacterium]
MSWLRNIVLLTTLVFFSEAAFSSCPDWIKNRADTIPLCPKGDNTILPETFPTSAVIVSDGSTGWGIDSAFTSSFVNKVLNASNDNPPLMLLTVSKGTFDTVVRNIDALPVDIAKKQKWKSALIRVPAPSYTWQQDYFESFFNKKGEVVLRIVDSYKFNINKFDSEKSFKEISKAVRECGFKTGSPLKNLGEPKGGYRGGNIEGLPGGFCLFGDDAIEKDKHWEFYSDQFCGKDPENKIKVPTSWLSIGHTDEIMKVIKNNNKKEPCNFSIAISSPKKAIELLRNNQEKPFLFFPQNEELLSTRAYYHRGISHFCNAALDLIEDEVITEKKSPNTSKIDFKLINFFINRAYAGVTLSFAKPLKELTDCHNMTNKHILKVLTSNNTLLKKYNELIQQKMDDLKKQLTAKLKKRLPSCTPDFIDVPDIFFGGQAIQKKDGTLELSKRFGESLLPNSTNSVSVDNTIIAPISGSQIFEKYIKSEYKKRGLESDFIDTFDYAHMGGGNLHCATHTLHICNPRSPE